MRRSGRISVAMLVISGLSAGIAPAVAQFGGIFGDPPRPPSNVPNRPPSQDDRFMPPVYPQTPQQVPPAPPQAMPAPPPGRQDAIQSQPLAPPPGLPTQPAAAPSGPPPGPYAPAPGQMRPGPPGPPSPSGPPLADPSAPQTEEVVIAPPAQKIVNPTAVFAGLDKITGRITTFDVSINETVQFGALQVTPRACYTRPPTETQNTDAFVQVDEITLQGEVKRIFSGWMFAASPGLHAVEHPIYDVWLTECKGAAPPVTQAQAPPPPPARSTRPAQRPRR